MEMHDKNICEIKETLSSMLRTYMARDISQVDTEEAYKIADIIKDMAEAEMYEAKKAYYDSIVTAMKEYDEDDRAGYNSRRYANGRYAPKGKGMMRGYHPPYPMMPPVYDYEMPERMGYMPGYESQHDSHYGKAYDKYQDARRHYTQTHAQKDKDDMDAHATEHLANTVASIREIWKHADPEMRNRMKSDITVLMNDMNIPATT